MNRVTLFGNLGADPELKFTQGGAAILKLRVATTEYYRDKQTNERRDITEWHNVVMWQKNAETLSKMLQKGSKVLIEGKIQTRQWEDKDGVKRYTTEINAHNVQICDGNRGNRQTEATQPAGTDVNETAYDDDIPF